VELTKVSQEARAFGRPTPKHMDVYCPANVIALSFFVVVGFFRTQLARAAPRAKFDLCQRSETKIMKKSINNSNHSQ
jgi:hypothetical protein